jgi:acid stress-induced BolA-like protein IbaG/YrbA
MLLTRFKGAEVEIDNYPESDRTGATVIWKGFEGKDEIERQRLVRKAIEKGLGPQQARKISLVLTFTPDEMAAIREG